MNTITTPQTTIVIPTYNRAPWIGETVHSVLNQSFRDLEVIVVDDGSTDQTKEIVTSIRDARLSYYACANSGSPAKPRNEGLRLARGRTITFLDDDDRWFPERLKKTLACFAKDPTLDLVCHNENMVRDGQIVRTHYYGPNSDSLYVDMLLTGNRLSTSTTTLKTDLVRRFGGFDERREFFAVEDFDLWLRLAKKGAKFCFLEEVLSEGTLGTGNISARQDSFYRNHLYLYESHFQMSPELLDEKMRQRILARNEFVFARDYHQHGMFAKASQKYWGAHAAGYRPLKLYAGLLFSLLHMRV